MYLIVPSLHGVLVVWRDLPGREGGVGVLPDGAREREGVPARAVVLVVAAQTLVRKPVQLLIGSLVDFFGGGVS